MTELLLCSGNEFIGYMILFFIYYCRLSQLQSEKPASLDLPFAPPLITITTNFDDTTTTESDVEVNSRASGSGDCLGLRVPSSGMCYLSPFSIVTRGERVPSESNLSSSGYSSMASPGPSRCCSNNPLFPGDLDESGTG